MVSRERRFGRLNSTFGSSHSASSAYQKWPTWHVSVSLRVSSRSLAGPRSTSRSGSPPDCASRTSPKMFVQVRVLTHLNYPEGNFRRNQLTDDSISLSPLCPVQEIDLHVRISTDLHQGFP
ncbi:hypothetical protein Phum_PHUM351800 [Pediculus humanus corporis]|uniref:Uncharacterized protein n=1 Tax=Pediculus humanus subsp. corporis TaxID=121224 RepID=E0VP53_PEDHC|nr:hypothetical protein Phum_PHUM351800 [Pediculus humanus corporis]